MTHPWHQINTGESAPEVVTAVIEIPNGSRAKYELDKDTGLLKLDRVLFSSIYYPANYGFIPQTLCDDKDPLDILVLSQVKVEPLCMLQAKVIGVMQMLDAGEADDKIIAVAEGDMSVNHINDISELPEHYLTELRTFFEDYKKLEKKSVKIEEFLGAKVAQEIVVDSMKMYKEKF